MNIKNWLKHHIRKQSVTFQDIKLPALHLRTGGKQFRDNSYFVQSAHQEIARLQAHFHLSNKPILLDVGCGYGRLAIGFLSLRNKVSYIGIDVNKSAINWCQKNITNHNPNFQFIHLNLQNNRYNPKGQPIDFKVKLPFEDESIEVVYLYSVFSHMLQNDVKHYLHELNRILIPKGNIFFTAFSEPDVPVETVNPPDYQNIEWKDALHCVRYNHHFLLALIEDSRLVLDQFEYGQETEGQSAFYLSKHKQQNLE